MSLIVHRCTRCNHPDIWAIEGTTAGPARAGIPTPLAVQRPGCSGRMGIQGQVRCHPGACTYGPPEQMAIYDSATGQPIPDVYPPGANWMAKPGSTRNIQRVAGVNTTCDCDACKKLYAQLTATTERTTAP
jgi:hypothetical protein